MLDPQSVNHRLDKLVKAAGLARVNVHALRHTYATRMLEAGVPPKVVQELLGHSTIAQTMDTYMHVMPELKHAAADALDALLNPGCCQVVVKRK
jgi:integrase